MNMRFATKCGAISLSVVLLVFTAGPRLSKSAPRSSKPIVIGMIPLLAAPQKYDGKVIQTWGFLNLRYEDDSLWLHREDLQASLWKDSFALQLTQKQREQFKGLNHTYVMVQGTLHSKGPDGDSLDSGTIAQVTLVHGWTPFVPFETKKK
jgi:hypothetical protein